MKLSAGLNVISPFELPPLDVIESIRATARHLSSMKTAATAQLRGHAGNVFIAQHLRFARSLRLLQC